MRNGIEKPWSVSIELTEGCNRRCLFCGIHSLFRNREDVCYKFLSIDLAKAIAFNLGEWKPKCRIEFALQGEPLLNSNALEIVKVFRQIMPKAQLQMTSNCDLLQEGKTFQKSTILSLFDAGLNILLADYYGNSGLFTDFKERLFSVVRNCDISCYDFYVDKESPWHYKSSKIRQIIALDSPISHRSRVNRSLNNQAGNANPEFLSRLKKVVVCPKKSRCSRPFRELVIKYDGVVTACCMDWQRELIIGKFNGNNLKEIWQSRMFNLLRKLLYEKDRAIIPCRNCDFRGEKVGLLPDPMLGNYDRWEILTELTKLQERNKIFANKYAYKGWK